MAVLITGLVAIQPLLICFFLVIGVVSAVWNIRHCRRLRRLSESRPGESICTFARSFEYRLIDTRIIRATHEELLDYYAGLCPIRASDRLREDIEIDEEDLDDVAVEIARRAGRTLDRWSENPLIGRVETIADLVHFLAQQPTAKA